MMVGLSQTRIFHIRREATSLESKLEDEEATRLKEFQDKIKEDDEIGALEKFQTCNNEEAQVEMMRSAVTSRKNELVTKMLSDALDKCRKGSKGEGQTPSLAEDLTCKINLFQQAIFFCTLNDDPETLEAILEWGDKEEQKAPTETSDETKNKNCPILVASLENFTQCIQHLYRFGYRINLPGEDRERIDTTLKVEDTIKNLLSALKHIKLPKKHKICKDTINFDPVERFMRFKAWANPDYIFIEFLQNVDEVATGQICNDQLKIFDPIRKSFVLYHDAKYLSSYYTQHSQQYAEICTKLEDFSQDVLEQCENVQEVETLLEYSPNMDDGDGNQNWQLALSGKHKKFVAHHYFQNFLQDKLTGDNFEWDNYIWLLRIFYLPYTILMFCVVPIVVFSDSLFRRSDILFVAPLKQKKIHSQMRNETEKDYEQALEMSIIREGRVDQNSQVVPAKIDEGRFFSYFRKIIHRPIFRMIVYHFLELVCLVALGLHIIDPRDVPGKAEWWFYDIVTYFCMFNYLIEDVIDLFRNPKKFFTSFWSKYSLFCHALFVIGSSMACYGFDHDEEDQRANLSGNHIINIGSTFVSIAARLEFLRTLRWILLQRTLGPVVVCIIRVLNDAFHIFLIFIIIYVAFAIGTFSMFKPFGFNQNNGTFTMSQTDLTHISGTFLGMMWRILDPGEPEMASVYRNSTGELSLQFSHGMGLVNWAIYQFIIVILLTNILIAMMNTTYTKVYERADLEWKYSKSFYQAYFLSTFTRMPPPFRMLYYFAKLVRYLKRNHCCCQGCDFCCEERNKERVANCKVYLKLLQKLVQRKQHSDYENCIQDDFRDLRQDMQNLINDKLKNLQKENADLKNVMNKILNKLD